MGMDSVELLMAFERHFQCEVPTAVAETLYTVSDVATWFSQQLGVAGRQSAVRLAVEEQLRAVLATVNSRSASYSETTVLREIFSDQQQLENCRQQLLSRYQLRLPRLAPVPDTPAVPSLWEKIWGRPLWSPPNWPTQTLAELTDWVVAPNYERLLSLPLASQYEVEQAIIGITSNLSGVEVEEVQLRSNFVNDLGID